MWLMLFTQVSQVIFPLPNVESKQETESLGGFIVFILKGHLLAEQ